MRTQLYTMTTELKNKILAVCDQIAEDTERDVKNLDGQPFDGKTVARQFGYHAASIKALADMVKMLAQNSSVTMTSPPFGESSQ